MKNKRILHKPHKQIHTNTALYFFSSLSSGGHARNIFIAFNNETEEFIQQKPPKDHQDPILQQKIITKTKLMHVFGYSTQKINLFTSTTEEEESLVFNRKESWEFGTSLGFLACITTVRDSLRARHDLGVAGSVSLDFFTCPFALPILS
jgi:hypothetical protein